MINKEKNKKIAIENKHPYSKNVPLVKTSLLGIGVTRATKETILEYVLQTMRYPTDCYYIVTPNPEMIVESYHNDSFQHALNTARIALCDGMGLLVASKILSNPVPERITGTAFMEMLCSRVADLPITVGFLGGGDGVAEKVSNCLKERYPGLKVIFAASEWPESNDKELKIKDKKEKSLYPSSFIFNHSVDILFVAFGHPKQELWMAEMCGKIPVKVMMGVGGAFDQIINPSLRPPKFIEAVGLGWLYRLIRQPWRWKRQLALFSFIALVIKEKAHSNKLL